MELFDTHFHFYGEATPAEYMKSVAADLETAAARVQCAVPELYLTAVGGDYLESCRAREFAAVVPKCRFAAGVHPHQAAPYLENREDFSVFRNDPRLAAIGELGLDYFYDHSDHNSQQLVLKEFLDLALEWDLPAIIHLRDKDDRDSAYQEGFALLQDFAGQGGRFVVHCFSGTVDWAEKFLELGAYLGVTGMVTFRRAENIREIVRMIPPERLLLETDSPYLAPVPFRGRENTPGLLLPAAACAAAECDRSIAEILELTTGNAKKFFRWTPLEKDGASC